MEGLIVRDQDAAPADIADLPLPRIMFVGSLDPRQDWDLFEQMALQRPQWSWILIGGVADATIRKRFVSCPSVHFLGRKPYYHLGPYLRHADVCIQFYNNSRLNHSGNSLKLPLYLAFGKPVVSTATAGAENYKGLIEIAKTPDDFISSIEKALTEDNGELQHTRIQAAYQNSWAVRIKDIIGLIDKHILMTY
jgi:glycosyltransferase involved in cell wall biosynthesis